MAGMREALDRQLDRRRERRAYAEVVAENERLRLQVERLRAAMRRCTSCEYRINQTRPERDSDDHLDPLDLNDPATHKVAAEQAAHDRDVTTRQGAPR